MYCSGSVPKREEILLMNLRNAHTAICLHTVTTLTPLLQTTPRGREHDLAWIVTQLVHFMEVEHPIRIIFINREMTHALKIMNSVYFGR